MISRKKIIFGLISIILVFLGFQNGSLFTKGAKVADQNVAQVVGAENATSSENSSQNKQENNAASLITEPQDGIAPIVSAIKNAKTSVDVVMYQMEDPSVEQALTDDASRGVTVRVILNGGYYGVPDEPNVNADAYQFFLAHGVQAHWSPAQFALTHQKSIVIDNTNAIIMTFNFTPQYYASSRDFAVVDTDANDVSAIESTFATDWNNQNTTALNGDDLVWSPNSEDALISFIENAQSSILIYNEEMNDDDIVNVLVQASKNGVNVEVVMTSSPEWTSNFKKLKAAGVKIGTYTPKAALYIHAKMILTDNAEVFLGSENFSPTSLLKNRELGLVLNDSTIISSLSSIFQKDFTGAKQF